MNTTILNDSIAKLKGILDKDTLIRIAYESDFIQRSTAKLCPMALVIVMVVEMSLLGNLSLKIMCELIQQYDGSLISSQALSQKINSKSAVAFFKKIYSEIMKKRFSNHQLEVKNSGILARFNSVYLEDSTSCQLHEKAANDFKGCGGSASKAGYKMHTLWNATKNCLENMYISSASVTDQSQCNNILKHLKKGDLILRDLGYFSTSCFKNIIDKGGYFLSRLKSGVNVYSYDGELIKDLGTFLNKQLKDKQVVEVNVFLGAKCKTPVRLIASQVPQSVYDERVRKLRRSMQKKGSTPSKSNLQLQRFTTLVTNVSKELLSSEEAIILYKLRWQIELIFKSFKGNFKVDMIKGHSPHRIECFILSKLIAITLATRLFSYYSSHANSCYNRELSFYMFTNWMLANKHLLHIFEFQRTNKNTLQMSEKTILSICKQKRSRKTSKELLDMEVSLSEVYPTTG